MQHAIIPVEYIYFFSQGWVKLDNFLYRAMQLHKFQAQKIIKINSSKRHFQNSYISTNNISPPPLSFVLFTPEIHINANAFMNIMKLSHELIFHYQILNIHVACLLILHIFQLRVSEKGTSATHNLSHTHTFTRGLIIFQFVFNWWRSSLDQATTSLFIIQFDIH